MGFHFGWRFYQLAIKDMAERDNTKEVGACTLLWKVVRAYIPRYSLFQDM